MQLSKRGVIVYAVKWVFLPLFIYGMSSGVTRKTRFSKLYLLNTARERGSKTPFSCFLSRIAYASHFVVVARLRTSLYASSLRLELLASSTLYELRWAHCICVASCGSLTPVVSILQPTNSVTYLYPLQVAMLNPSVNCVDSPLGVGSHASYTYATKKDRCLG